MERNNCSISRIMTLMSPLFLFILISVVSSSPLEDSKKTREIREVGFPLSNIREKALKKAQKTHVYTPADEFIQKDLGGTRCKTERDCSKDECCALELETRYKVCRKMMISGKRCHPFIKPGLSGLCPCAPGLTCALTAIYPRNPRVIYKCAEIPDIQLELEYDDM